MNKLRPFFYFYGSKWQAARMYPTPRFPRIVEPFAGSAGYAAAHHERDIVLVEADPLIAGLWRWLIAATSAEILALPLEVPTTVRELGLPPGPSALIGFWLTAASAGPCQTPNSRMRSGRRPHSFWGETIRARIASQVGAIRHWTVIDGDFTATPADEATWFVDPPYVGAGVHYRKRFNRHAELGDWCRTRRGQVIACENVGATWLPFETFRDIPANNHPGKHGKSAEAIWLSDWKVNEETDDDA